MPRTVAQSKRSLADTHPSLVEEWHPTKNGERLPQDFTHGSGKKVWWICSLGHEWETTPNHRTAGGTGCPFCRGNRVDQQNSLAAVNPELAKQWHPDRNGSVSPADIRPRSSQKIWWRCANGHEWKATVANRAQGRGCPYCSGRALLPENTLQAKRPDIALEWHPTENGDLTPREVSLHSNRKVWWRCSKNPAHEWPAVINSRTGTRQSGCPACDGKLATEGNCLQTLFPEVAEEWHPTLNSELTPRDVVPGSEKEVWWKCGKGHEWQAEIVSRTSGVGCKVCSRKIASPEYNLRVVAPQVADEWHPTLNEELLPEDVLPSSHQAVWWRCNARGHEWPATIASRTAGRGCRLCSPQRSRLEVRVYSELLWIFKEARPQETLSGWECDVFLPELNAAVEVDGEFWHRDKGDIDSEKTSELIDLGYFVMRVRDPGLEPITSNDIIRSQGESDCELVSRILDVLRDSLEIPQDLEGRIDKYVEGAKLRNGALYRRLIKDLALPPAGKSLAELYPEVADEWHPTRNSPLTPLGVHAKSHLEVWWKCSREHEWPAKISNRANGRGCPLCGSRGGKLAPENSLAATRPDIAAQWHPTLNDPLTPHDVSRGSGKKVWWRCSVDPSHEWEAHINNRTKPNGSGCRLCAGKRPLNR